MPNARARPCEEAAIQSIRVVQDYAASAKRWVLLTTILASSIAYLDESIVNVALPAIETDLATSVVVVQWLINAYTLTLSSLLLVGGAAGPVRAAAIIYHRNQYLCCGVDLVRHFP